MQGLRGKRAVVVGGGSGIGRATAALFLERGAEVWVAGRTEAKLRAAIAGFATKDRAHRLRFDATDEASVAAAIEGLPENGIDYLVTTASVARQGAFADLPLADAQALFDSKFWGPYRVARAMLPKLRQAGAIVFFSGVLSRRPGLNCSGLAAVNAAVEGLARGLALELGPRLRVNCISPGMTRSEAYAALPEARREAMYSDTGASLPVGRVGTTEEIAAAVLFAATCGYLTGQVIDVDGGHMIRQYATR